MIKRLFIKLPLYALQMLIMFTVVIPLGYYIITGKDYLEFDSKLEDTINKL